MATLYGLLVGIDTYPNPRHNLKGCVNDITAFEAYLRERASRDGFDTPDLRILTDATATRANVIEGFRSHLTQAGKGDVALFYYSGHGAQEPAPEMFWGIEPDQLNETLVCYDSRTEQGWDLADKELARLLAEIARNGPHIVVVLDCCHSGSGTRAALVENDLHATAVRRIPTDTRRRPLAEYLFWHELGSRDMELDAEAWKLLPGGDHVLLAACQDNQLAKEYVADGKTFGTFSYFLRTILTESQRSLSYGELIARTRARVESHKADQRPVLEVKRDSALGETFLGGAVADRPPLLTHYDRRTQAWTLAAGAAHGIPEPRGTETTRLALFDPDAPSKALRDPSKRHAEAVVRSVRPDRSMLDIVDVTGGSELDPKKEYLAVVTALPLPPLPVRFEGDEAGVAAARHALANAGHEGGPSLYIREDDQHPSYRLLARSGEYLIAQTADDRPLVREIEGGYTEANAKKAIERLEHIARWHKIADLANPGGRIEADAIMLILDGDPVTRGSITRHYRYEDGSWQQPHLRLQLKNTSNERLYCALIDLSESYAVGASLLPGGGVWLGPGEAIDAYDGKPIPTSVPDALWNRGVTERKDILKLVVSHTAFDAQLMRQEKLDQPRDRSKGVGETRSSPGSGGTLERLMTRMQTREIGADAEVDSYDDWIAEELVVVTVRPREEVAVPREGTVPLGPPATPWITVAAHPRLRATARLTSEVEVGRDYTGESLDEDVGLGALVSPDLFGEEPEVSQPLFFSRARGQDPGLSVLELRGVENHSTVTAEAPLELFLDVDLDEDEHLLPVAYDGEFYLPVGRVAADGARAAGRTRVVIERLPDPAGLEARSLTGSIRILFQKFIGKAFPAHYRYPLLAIGEIAENGKVHYESSPEKVAAAVANAERILLFVHGILGDTTGMVAGLQRPIASSDGAKSSLADRYDLLLTFDYENLDTPIDQTAEALEKRLESAGLGPGHGKTLDVVAHSMGGLVSRWYVEKLGGHEVVDHLVMLGTPNAGSPWATLQDWATTAAALVLNRLSRVFWPAQLLASLTALIERVDVSLDQMHPHSDFLTRLAKLPDRSVRYTILAGNTQLIAPDSDAHEKRHARVDKLLAKLRLRQRTYDLLDTAVFKEANDIAVAVTSIKNVRGSPSVYEVASDHLSYFLSDAGLEALSMALTGETVPDGNLGDPEEPRSGERGSDGTWMLQGDSGGRRRAMKRLGDSVRNRRREIGVTENSAGQSDEEAAAESDEEAAEATEEPTSGTVTLHGRAAMHDVLELGTISTVEVTIGQEALASTDRVAVDASFANADPERDLIIQAIPKAHVEIVGDDRIVTRVPKLNAPFSCYFDVRPTHLGSAQVWIVVRQGSAPLHTFALEAQVIETRTEAFSRTETSGEATTYAHVSAPAHQLRIFETAQGDATVYMFDLFSKTLGVNVYHSRPIQGDRDAYIAGLYEKIEDRWLSSHDDTTAFAEELRAFGGELLDQLIPHELQRVLWDHRDEIDQIFVISTEPFIPWELVHLKEPGQGLPNETHFLGQMGLARWLHNSPWPAEQLRIRRGRARYVIPHYPELRHRLPEAEAEAGYLERTFGAQATEPQPNPVRELLRQAGGFDLLHFACHGEAGGDAFSAQLLLEGRQEGGRYVPTYLDATLVEQHGRFRSDGEPGPMVVLNACQIGRREYRLTGIGGFADAFLRRGAGAFVGTLWSVGDGPARIFTEALYQQLIEGKTLAEATTVAREAAQRAGDATWIAYAVYGHPDATLNVDG